MKCPFCNAKLYDTNDGWYCHGCRREIKISSLVMPSIDKIDKVIIEKQEEHTMKVSYKGHTGNLIRLELAKNYRTTERLYDLVIAKDEFDDPQSIFIGIKLEEIKFIGGSVSFE